MSRTVVYDNLQAARLETERMRTQALLIVLILLLALTVVAGMAGGSPDSALRMRMSYAVLIPMVVCEAWLLLYLRKGAITDRAWRVAALVETGLPVLGLAVVGARMAEPGRLLAAPTVSVLFLFLLVSILRLDPALSLGVGLVSAAGFYAALDLVLDDAGGERVAAIAAVLLAVGGAVAAFVSHRMDTYLRAAVKEAETRRAFDLLQKEMDVAREIQQGLLPNAPAAMPGYSLAGFNRPAGKTGGDFYDWVALDGGRTAITLADVSGHGIGPALVAASCRVHLRAALAGGSALERVFEQVNAELFADLPGSSFVTAVCGIVDPESGRVEMLSAGHGPLIHYRADADECDVFGSDGVPLGLLPGSKYPAAGNRVLNAGDMIVLLTDGLVEWENGAGEQYGIDRAIECIRDSRGSGPAEIIERLCSGVERFSGGTAQEDDVTVVILKREM